MVGGERIPDTNWGNTCSLLSYKDRIQNLGVGWVYSSVIKYLPSMYKALGSVPSTAKERTSGNYSF